MACSSSRCLPFLDPTHPRAICVSIFPLHFFFFQPKVVAGYVSDGAASDGSAPADSGAAETAVADKSRSLAALGLSQSRGGGTFSGSYERLPSWGDEEAGASGVSGIVPRSISVNSDGGGYGAGAAGTRSLSVNSDAPPGTDRECRDCVFCSVFFLCVGLRFLSGVPAFRLRVHPSLSPLISLISAEISLFLSLSWTFGVASSGCCCWCRSCDQACCESQRRWSGGTKARRGAPRQQLVPVCRGQEDPEAAHDRGEAYSDRAPVVLCRRPGSHHRLDLPALRAGGARVRERESDGWRGSRRLRTEIMRARESE